MKKDWNARLEEITQTDKAIWATGRAFAGIDEAGRCAARLRRRAS
mgnify:CR=1 FL=1